MSKRLTSTSAFRNTLLIKSDQRGLAGCSTSSLASSSPRTAEGLPIASRIGRASCDKLPIFVTILCCSYSEVSNLVRHREHLHFEMSWRSRQHCLTSLDRAVPWAASERENTGRYMDQQSPRLNEIGNDTQLSRITESVSLTCFAVCPFSEHGVRYGCTD